MQNEELAYVIVTPYSMRKSRTGGIVGRLISRTGLDLVGGRMFAPSAELAKRYADSPVPAGYAESFVRPLARRRLRIARPAFVDMRARKPCLRLRRRTFG